MKIITLNRHRIKLKDLSVELPNTPYIKPYKKAENIYN